MKVCRPQGAAFSLVEVLVTITIISLMIALLLPALGRAREAARGSVSSANLHTYGRALAIYGAENAEQQYCSGAFDHFNEGDIRERGWIADVIRGKIANPKSALDPSNFGSINRVLLDAVGVGGSGPVNENVWGGGATPASVSLTNLMGPTEQKLYWETGPNTNYATTWYLVRGDATASDGFSNDGDPTDPPRSPLDGDGPYSAKHESSKNVLPERVAFMGSARATADPTVAVMTEARVSALRDFSGFDVSNPGELTVESFTDGMKVDFTDTTFGGGPGQKMHSFVNILPSHGTFRGQQGQLVGGWANILFADMHVEKIRDEGGLNGEPDGFIGPYRTSLTNAAAPVTINRSGWEEITDRMWFKRLAPRDDAGS